MHVSMISRMALPETYLQMISTVSPDGELQMRLAEMQMPTPDPDEVWCASRRPLLTRQIKADVWLVVDEQGNIDGDWR